MIKFNECRITEDGGKLIIEASVNNMDYYDDVYIESVIIDTDRTYTPNGPSGNPVYSRSFVPEDTEDSRSNYVDRKYPGEKKISLRLCSEDFEGASINSNMFFVYVIATGIPSPDTPCGMDNQYVMTVAVNLRPVYNNAMKFINELNVDCRIPKGFIDMILRLKGLSLSLKTGHMNKAIDIWHRLLKDRSVPNHKGCRCNGTYT